MWSIRYRTKSNLAYPRYRSTKGNNKKTLIPLSVLAKEYKYHSDYLSQLIRKGEIEGEKIGRSWCTTRSQIERYKLRKQYVTLGHLLKPYAFEIIVLLLGVGIFSFGLVYWRGVTVEPISQETQTELGSDLDVSISYSLES